MYIRSRALFVLAPEGGVSRRPYRPITVRGVSIEDTILNRQEGNTENITIVKTFFSVSTLLLQTHRRL